MADWLAALSGVAGTILPVKIVLSLIAVIFPILFFRQFLFRLARDRQSESRKSHGVLPGLALVGLIAVLLLTVSLVKNPNQASTEQQVADAQSTAPQKAKSLPSQSLCPYADCGMGGPSIDAEDYPEKLRPEDYRRYLESKSRSIKPSDVCSVAISQTSKDLYDARIRLSPGAVCQRFFAASTSSAVQLLEYRRPTHGRLTVDNRSFKYEADTNYSGADAFLLQQCVIGQEMAENSCMIIRYSVEAR